GIAAALRVASHQQSVRPPRELTLAIAWYLVNLTVSPTSTPSVQSRRGEALFSERCSECDAPPGYAGPAVPLVIVGTYPASAPSPDAASGPPRGPSLRRLSRRRMRLPRGRAPLRAPRNGGRRRPSRPPEKQTRRRGRHSTCARSSSSRPNKCRREF